MCGIAGFILPETPAAAERRLERMTDVIRHRGPDGHGHIVLPAGEPGWVIGLGHRRLAIIDLSEGGRQPMATDDHSAWITYNGELYNFAEVRRHLADRGEVFRSRSDTEVLLRALVVDGERALDRCNGMWAFALWDGRRRRLLLSRDRLGVKPLYYAEHEGGLLFGSEIKALLAAGVPAKLRPNAVDEYLRYGYTVDPETPFAGIRQLEPGSILVHERGASHHRRYWTLRPFLEHQKTATADELLGRLDMAVQRQVISDVPLGAFLSGGLDSSAIVAAMATQGQGGTRTFCVSFGGSAADEAPFARLMADHVGAIHTEHAFAASDVGDIEKTIRHMDEPYADDALLPTYAMCRVARDHVTVALSGDGGDELFAGYDRYRTERLVGSLGLPGRAAMRVAEFGARLTHGVASPGQSRDRIQWLVRLLQTAQLTPAERYGAKLALCSSDFLHELAPSANHEPDARLAGLLTEPSAEDSVARMLYADVLLTLPNQMLRKVDRMSMAASLEVRVPFLDHELVEFAASLPSRQRIRAFRGKHLLRKALARRLPRPILQRAKHGFDVPLDRWFRGDLTPFLHDTLTSQALARHGIFSHAAVEHVLRQHEMGLGEWSRVIFAVLTFQLWHDAYFRGRAYQNGAPPVGPASLSVPRHELAPSARGASDD